MKKRAAHQIMSKVLVFLLVFTALFSNGTKVWAGKAAKTAKKATIKSKSITLTVGSSKKITIKNKQKKASYTFGSKNKKIASVSKAGVIKAKKAGKTKITVKEKLNKKTRTVGKVSVTVKKKNQKKDNTKKDDTKKTDNGIGDSGKTDNGSGDSGKTDNGSGDSGKTDNGSGDSGKTDNGSGDSGKTDSGKEDSGTDNPGTDDPGKDNPGTDDPGKDDPGKDDPGKDDPGKDDPGKDDPGKDDPETEPTTVYLNRFEDGDTKGILPRGGASLEISNSENHSEGGKNCLVILSRTATWHGATMDLKKLTKVSETYEFSAWVKLVNAGTHEIDMTLEYKDTAGNSQWRNIGKIDATASEWVHLTGSYKIPEYSDVLNVCFEIPDSETESFYLDDFEMTGIPVNQVSFKMTDEIYSDMVQSSFLSSGNNAKMKKVIEKAKKGENVTIAVIGGSITEGALATPNSNCYAQTLAKLFAEKFGKDGGANVHFVNAGMSGTPSSLGIIRYQRDVIGQMEYAGFGSIPDALFIEFAVNDAGEATDGGAYEGLIRKALSQGTAVFLIFAAFQGDGVTPNTVCQSKYIPFGEYYDLPMISMGNAMKKYFTQDGFQEWYFGDSLHPNNSGHRLMADCIMNVLETMDKEDAEADNIPDVLSFKAKKTDSYQDITMIDASTDVSKYDAIKSIDAGGFTQKDPATCSFQYEYKGQKAASWFPDNFMHGADSSSDSLKITAECRTLMIVYKASNSSAYGSADLYIDGVKKKTLSCYESTGWNNAKVDVVFTDSTAKEHTIELKMADGNEKKCFTMIGFGIQ